LTTEHKKRLSWLALLLLGVIIGCALVFILMWLREYLKPENNKGVFLRAVESTTPIVTETQRMLADQQPIPSYNGNLPTDIMKLERLPEGDIVFYTSAKQMMWLHPQVNNVNITWVCYGSPARFVQSHCPASK